MPKNKDKPKIFIGQRIETEWIDFVLRELKPKTQVWMLFSKDDETAIGIVKWYPSWRHYCFFPFADTVYSDRCLGIITNFVKERNELHVCEK